MPKISAILDSLFLNNGANTYLWDSLKKLIQNQSDEIVPFCFIIRNKIIRGNKSEILLAFAILDFAVDSGRVLLWEKIDNKDFLSIIVNLLKTNSDLDLQETALYLIQKWSNKFKNYPSLQNCNNVYNSLKNNNIFFPTFTKNLYQSYLIQGNNNNQLNNKNPNSVNNNTNNMIYNNFNNNNVIYNNKIFNNNNVIFNNKIINNNNIINNNMNNKNNINNINNINANYQNDQNNNNQLRLSRVPSDPVDYVKNLRIDLNTSSYEKKYRRLVNKLYDWVNSIQEINILIDNNYNCQNNNKIKVLCEELKKGYFRLVSTIQGPKLKNETLMEISLKVSEDMFMTFSRGEKSLNGKSPGPFLSSFTRNDNPNINKRENKESLNYETNDFKNKDPLEKIGKLGFGDTIVTQYMDDDENTNNNSLGNTLNDLFEKNNKSVDIEKSLKTNVDYKVDDNDLFTNMSNSDLNDSIDNNLNINEYSTTILTKDNNNKKVVDNNDIKRLINNNAYDNDANNYMVKSQNLPAVHMNINDGLYNEPQFKNATMLYKNYNPKKQFNK